MKFFDRFKRHRQGWPRGVRPMVPALGRIQAENPLVWEEVRHMPAGTGLKVLAERGLI